MNNINIIQIHQDDSYVCWQYQSGRLLEVTANASGCWWALVPGTDVLMLQATLPKLSGKALQESLPYAFEESLLEDVSDLHFSLLDRQDDGLATVAVVAKRTLRDWLAQLDSLGVQPEKMLPDYMLVPYEPDHVQVGLDKQMALVRNEVWQGFTVPSDNLEPFLKNLSMKKDDMRVAVYADDPLPLKLSQPIINAPSRWSQWLVELIEQGAPVNLLQGEFRPQLTNSTAKRWWAVVITLFVLSLGLSIGNQAWQFMSLQRQQKSLQTRISHMYQQLFPDKSMQQLSQAQIASLLARLRHSAQGDHFLQSLAKVGAVLKAKPAITLQALVYQDQMMALTLQAKSSQILQKFTQQLKKQGLSFKIVNTEQHDQYVQIKLQLGGQ